MLSLSYVLAASLRELFPDVDILQVKATSRCFFCDIRFPGEFSQKVMSFLEERMRSWVAQRKTFKVFEMVPSNAAQFMEHQGEKKLARLLRNERNLVALLQLDRFFFRLEDEAPTTTGEIPFFKLVSFYPRKFGIRILGTGAGSQEKLKKLVSYLKNQKDLQNRLEELKIVGWLQNQLIWESRGEILKDLLRKKIMTLYQEFDRVFIATSEDLKKILPEWVSQRKRSGFEFRTKVQQRSSQEPWDTLLVSIDRSWGKVEESTSFLHLATKFLTMLSFDYKVVSTGKINADIKKNLEVISASWSLRKGNLSRLEFYVEDRLGQEWEMSSLEWDQKQGFVQMSLCCSFERCIALLVDRLEVNDIETLLNRLR